MKAPAAGLLLLLASSALAGGIRLTSVQPTDLQGRPVQPMIGDTFYLTARMQVDASLHGPYRVKFELPYASRTSAAVSYTGSAWMTWGPYEALVDGPVSIKATILPARGDTGSTLQSGVTFTLPQGAIETFDSKTLSGWLRAGTTLVRGSASDLTWMTPSPAQFGFQEVLSVSAQGLDELSDPHSLPVIVGTGLTAETTFQTRASSVRSNPVLLRQATFADYASVPEDVRSWLQPETRVQSRSPEIGLFVRRSLPRSFASSMRPYDAARKLFQAVIAQIRYVPMTQFPDALAALRTGRGDCGAFSALFVAACRNAGIPAREVTGMELGSDEWHIWTEFYIPGAGWIPADPAYSDGLCPSGSLALYFGVIPELNSRAATTLGFDHRVGAFSTPMLQSSAVQAFNGARIGAVVSHCHLEQAASN